MVHRMRSTLHSYSSNHLNPFHLEDDVWSHTMLVLKCMDTSNLEYDWEERMMYLIALLHDNGKVFKRNSHTPGRISFFDHDQAGVSFALNVTLKYFEDSTDSLLGHILYVVINIVGKHDAYYRAKSKDELKLLLNNNSTLEKYFRIFAKADSEGKFRTEEGSIESVFEQFPIVCDHSKIEVRDEDIPFWIYCGSPGSGKDYIASCTDYPVYSFDKTRISIYKEQYPDCNDELLYEKVHEYCKRKNLCKIMFQKMNEDKIQSAIICNKNLYVKSRKEILLNIKKYFSEPVGCVFVLNTEQNCIENDIMRPDKTVGKKVIAQSILKMSIPTEYEGFSKVNLILNDYSLTNKGGTRTITCKPTLY